MRGVPGFARAERTALADLLAEVGPHAPTLCEGWQTYDLAAHLVTRDRVPKAMPGLIVPRLHGITERAERRTRDAHSYPDLISLVRSGPPRWSPAGLGPVDEAVNAVEYTVHHEDVLRAGGDAKPRTLDVAHQDALWARLKSLGRISFRRLAVGAVAERTDAPGRLRLRGGEPAVTILGTPVDLVLYAFGRRAAAGVEISGDPAAVAAVRAARIGP